MSRLIASRPRPVSAFLRAALCLTIASAAVVAFASQPQRARAPAIRMYVLDCGNLGGATPLSMAAYLIVHPTGSLLWEAGGLPDSRIEAGGNTDGLLANLKNATAKKTLRSQLKAIGYQPANITYFAVSHYHDDHTANANDYHASIWLVQRIERDAMFAEGDPPRFADPSFYSALKSSKAILLDGEYDVFGDGTVIIKPAPGHTPGHQVLLVRLRQTGNVLLSGDLYHRSAERVNGEAPPAYDFSPAQDAASRKAIEAFLKQSGTALWIEHDMALFRTMRVAPGYYE